MTDRLNVLIVGGYGTFGGRIVELLENEPRLILTVSGRSLEKASRFCNARGKTKAHLIPVAFDRNGDIVAQLASLQPDILVDASGPFQAYGNDRYRVIEACIDHRVNYLDLADGSDFVAGVHVFDEAARAANRYVLSGVSSFPVLTAAVVRHLSSDMARVDAIRGGIAPSPYAGVGENVIRAIAGYAGQPLSLRRGGRAAIGHPFTEHMRFTIASPGYPPLRNTMFSLVDVPDLRALAELWPDVRSIWMGAGPVPEVLHRALAALAWLVRLRVIPTLSMLAPLMHFATNHLRWGEHRGGMFVEVEVPMDRARRSSARGTFWPRAMTARSSHRWQWRRLFETRLRGVGRRRALARPCGTWSLRIMKGCSPTERSIPASGTIFRSTPRRYTRAYWDRPGTSCLSRFVTCIMSIVLRRHRDVRA